MDISPLLRRRLTAEGRTDREIRGHVASKEWVRLRPGAYVPRSPYQALYAADRHRLKIAAALPLLAGGAVVSHQSAAVLHGLPLWKVPMDRVHVTVNRSGGGRRTNHLHVHTSPLSADEITEIGGIPVTNAARTLVDLARSIPFESAVIAGDAVLHRALASADDVLDVLGDAQRRTGFSSAAVAIGFMDARSESPGESRSRVVIMRLGYAEPDLQHEIFGLDGELLGRSDFYLEEGNVVGEFDGLQKYGRLVPDGTTSGEIVAAEKVREDAIRDTNRPFARWIWAELDTPAVIDAKLRRATERGRRMGEPLT